MIDLISQRNFLARVALALFAVLFIWWAYLNPFSTSDALVHSKYIWGSSYQLLAFVGGIAGLIISKHYGGVKSVLGRSILFFALGLLFQCFGQTFYSYYNLFANVQAPYPSLGDVGYFGSVVLYILGVLFLAKAAGVKFSLRSLSHKLQAIVVPLIMLVGSYLIFLQQYQFDWAQKLKIFLDFGYPLGQAFYVSIAILTLIVSRNILGGIMRKPVLLFLIALIAQYIADFNFLFQANRGTWFVGSYGDFLYMCSYLLMTLSIIFIGGIFKQIQNS